MILSTHGIVGSQIANNPYAVILSYATAQGYTLPTSGQQALQSQLLQDLITAGIWDKLDTFAVFATDGSSDFALIDWKRLTQYTAVNSPTFTTNQGFQGNGTSSYIDSNYNPKTQATNYSIDNASFGYYVRLYDSAPSTAENLWGVTNDGNNLIWCRYTSKRFYFNISSTVGFFPYSNFVNSNNCFAHFNKTGQLPVNIYKNGVLQDSGNLPSTNQIIPNANFNSLRYATSAFSDAQVSIVFAGANLTTEQSDFYNAINTYITSL